VNPPAGKSSELLRGLLGLILLVVLGGCLYLFGPWLLPVRIIEGPYLQQVGSNRAIALWYTTRPLRPGEAQFTVCFGSDERPVPFDSVGRRNRAVLTDLEPGQTYPYRLHLGRRVLAQASLRTAELPTQACSFVVLGDSGVGGQAQYRLARRICDVDPDFVLHTGDVVYPGGEREGYPNRFFAPYRELLAKACFWPTLGNHDWEGTGGAAYLEVFELPENGPAELPPETNYWFDYGPVRVAVINSNLSEQVLAGAVAPWLRQVFASGPASWRLVVLHHPPYTAAKHRPSEQVQRALVAAFEEARVAVVFSGHNHLYERTVPLRGGQAVAADEGVVYVVSGAGGARLYPALPPEQRPSYIAAQFDARHSFTHVLASQQTLRLRQIDIDGRLVDEWSLVCPAAD
jgi:hypothetical protein